MLKTRIKSNPIPKKTALGFLNMLSIEHLPTHGLNLSHPIYTQPAHRHLVPSGQPLHHAGTLLPNLGTRSAHHLPNTRTPSSCRNRDRKSTRLHSTHVPI